MLIIISLLRGLASVLKILLIKLCLWLPVLFALGYVVICAALGVPLGDEPGLTILIAGSIILVAVALTIAATMRTKRVKQSPQQVVHIQHHDPRPPRQSLKEEKRERREGQREQRRYDDEDYHYDKRQRERQRELRELEEELEYEREKRKRLERELAAQSSTALPVAADATGRHSADTDKADTPKYRYEKFETTTTTTTHNTSADSPAPISAPQKERFSWLRRRKDGEIIKPSAPPIGEKPLVFETRKDPSIIIMEYSDRLMIYKKCPNGGEPIFLEEEFKK